jgi:hypothetical protein
MMNVSDYVVFSPIRATHNWKIGDMMMNWNHALSRELVAPRMHCSLIIVGETKEGLPFCYEDTFALQEVHREQLVTTLEFSAINPLEKLHHVSFIEFSFRDRGILYYAFVDLIRMESKRNICSLTLSAPEELNLYQNRRYSRLTLPVRTPLTCRIVGVRRNSTHQGVAFAGQILDIAGGGLSFITSTRLFYPLYLELSFVLPDLPDKFVLKGEIVRVSHFSSDSYRIAVEFRDVSEQVMNQIDDYCSGGHPI